MNQENSIIHTITGHTELSDTKVEDWEEILHRYPAFGTGYLLLAQKLLQESNPSLPAAQQKAAIHFNDLHWLDYLLKGPATVSNNQVKVPTPIPVPEPEPEPVVNQDLNKEHDITVDANPVTEVPEPETIEPVPTLSAHDQEAAHPRLSSILSAQLADFQKPVDQSAALPTDAEPLYKTDYFASQGILQVKTQDELGKKVKRFTDWLKDMKKNELGGTPVLQTTEQEEAQIIDKAAASLKTEVVLTESMAEVLLQQGKAEQAKTVYQKLSLLYPEKSSYFASKIDSLL